MRKTKKPLQKRRQKAVKKTSSKIKKPGAASAYQRKPKEKQIGVITHYFSKISVGIIKLRAELRAGDIVHIKGVHADFRQRVNSMQLNHRDITLAKPGDEVGIKVIRRVHENDGVYRPSDR